MIILFKEEGEFQPSIALNQALDNIAYQCRSGNHLLMGSRNLLSRLAESPNLDKRTSSIIRNAAQRMTQQGALLQQSPWILEIDTANSSKDLAHLLDFTDPGLCEKSQLLTENPTDSSALASLAEIYIKTYFTGHQLSIRCNNGGGSTIGNTLKQITDTASGCVLCVVDSDRIFPGAKVGSTARAAKQAYKKVTPQWRARLHIIEQRELENIIPTDVRNHCIKLYAPHLLPTSINIERTQKFYSDHFCLKSGDSMCRMVSSIITQKQQNKLKEANEAHTPSPLEKVEPCGTCSNNNDCRRSSGFGAGFLGWVAEELKSKRVSSDPSGWREELTFLVRTVALLGIGNRPMRT